MPLQLFCTCRQKLRHSLPRKGIQVSLLWQKVCHYRDFNFPGFHFYLFSLILFCFCFFPFVLLLLCVNFLHGRYTKVITKVHKGSFMKYYLTFISRSFAQFNLSSAEYCHGAPLFSILLKTALILPGADASSITRYLRISTIKCRMVDIDRALFCTGIACCAGPEFFLRNKIS